MQPVNLLQPEPPRWLQMALITMQKRYPGDKFEAFMRHMALDPNDTPIPPNQPVPANADWVWLPRIRCHDCPGKLYTPGPDETINNFEVHLKNKVHREKVDRRVAANAVNA